MENLSQQGSNVLTKKINKVLDLRLENDKEALDALRELSKFYKDNTAEKRRNLRNEIEKRNVAINNSFLMALRNVKLSLDSAYKDVCHMNQSVHDMQTRLTETKTKTHTLIEQTGQLQSETKVFEMKQNIVSAFIEKFQLNENDISILRSGVVNQEMFDAVDKTKKIHSDCKLLFQVGCQTVASDILEQMTLYQEAAIERLFRYAQSRCRMIESPDPAELLPQAMARLQERPNLFKQLLEEYGANRRDILVRQFIDALTRGGRPIELRATEPKRYVGDMLAWLHQSVPVEKENLNFLLKSCDNTDIEETTQELLSNITEGVAHPLRVRIEHILVGEDNLTDTLILHNIVNLIKYYHGVMSQVVGCGQLNKTLTELSEMSEKTFLQSLHNRVSVLLNKVELPSLDLSPSTSCSRTLSLLGQLLSADNSAEGKQNQIIQTVSTVVNPLIVHVTECAAQLQSVETSVYLLNCFHFIQTSLSLHPYMDERLERLKAQCEAQMDTLTSEQASALVTHLSLGNIYTVLQAGQRQQSQPMSTLPGMDSASISNVNVKLKKLLESPDIYQLPQLTLLSSNNYRLAIFKRASTVICSIYKDLYQVVYNSDNLYHEPEQLLTYTPEYVENILIGK